MPYLRKLLPEEVTFTLTAEVDEIPVRGNALCSGDALEDKACEDALLARLDDGDIWAWACVTVTATYREFSGAEILGACSYRDEEEFKKDSYYLMLRESALDNLQSNMELAASHLLPLLTPRRQ